MDVYEEIAFKQLEEDLPTGTRVRHPRYGQGVVVGHTSSPRLGARVDYDNGEAGAFEKYALEVIEDDQAPPPAPVALASASVPTLNGHDLAEDEEEEDSWAPQDLGPFLAGTWEPPEPDVGLQRADGLQLLYAGKEHSVIGEMESGKSWFAAACAKQVMDEGGAVLYLHFEESHPGDTISKLLAIGADPDVIRAHFSFVSPASSITHEKRARLLALGPSLVVLDGVNEGMSLHGQPIREEDGAATFRRLIAKPFKRDGAAILSCDHVIKDKERRGRNSIGTVHKDNSLDGALIELDGVEPFGRGRRGRSQVFVNKDRPGFLRAHGMPSRVSGKTYMGDLVIDASKGGGLVDLTFHAPLQGPVGEPDPDDTGTGPVVHSGMKPVLLDILRKQPGLSQRQWKLAYIEAVKARLEKGLPALPRTDDLIRQAIDGLEHQGLVAWRKQGRAHLYEVVDDE